MTNPDDEIRRDDVAAATAGPSAPPVGAGAVPEHDRPAVSEAAAAAADATDDPWSLDDPGAPVVAVDADATDELASEDAAVADEASAAQPDDRGLGGCPYLAAAGGGWRSFEAIRDHRCAALDPPAVVALEKQRRLCLAGAHVRCPTYVAAREARDSVLASVPQGWSPERRFVRTTPVVVDAGARRSRPSPSAGRVRLVEVAVVALALVIAVLVGSRILGVGPGSPPEATPGASAVAGGASSTPDASAASLVPGTDGPDATPGTSGPAGSAGPSPEATAEPGSSAGPKPSASPAKKTYRVKKGDTLSAIAAKYGVTVSAIVKANKIKDASTIHVGQVLIIPTPAP